MAEGTWPGSASFTLAGPTGAALATAVSEDSSHFPHSMRTLDIPFRTTVLEWVEKEWMDHLTIAQNFIVYAFSLPLQLSQRQIIEIQDMVQQWVQWDILKSLANYHSVVKTLFSILKHTLTRDSLWISHIIAEEIFQCLSRDVHVLRGQLVLIFHNSESYKDFLACRGDLAQRLLDLLQDLLDSFPESSARPRLSKALVRLSRASGLHPTCLSLTDLQIMGPQVAAGAFGDIWKGSLRGQSVSVKIMRLFRDAEVRAAVQAFGREALIWRQLSHPNLLPFLGLYYVENRLCLVSPWMSNGHVLQFLENAPADTDRLSLMLDVAIGLEYLHGKYVVHGDLKGMNILVTPSRRACVADFGLSSIVDAMSLRFTHSSASARGGTSRYQAPELLMGETQNHYGSDVYAFACVCYEILTGKAPFYEFFIDPPIIFRVLAGVRPSRPATMPSDDGLWLLLQDCWSHQSNDRPNASQIVQHLVGPTVGAKTMAATVDWDETISSKCRRSLQDWPLLPSISEIERQIFGDDVAEACRECFPQRHEEPVLASEDLMSTELLLSPRWRSSGISTPTAEYDFSLEENFSLRRTLRSAMIPISCLTANHCVPVNSDGRSPQMCRVFLPTEDFEISHSPPLLPRRLGDAPRRVPTPNNFYSLFDNYKRMLAQPLSAASPAQGTSGAADIHPFSPPLPVVPFHHPGSRRVSMHFDGTNSLLGTPELDPSFTSPAETTASDNFAPTPTGSPFSSFESPLLPLDDDTSFGGGCNGSGLDLFGGQLEGEYVVGSSNQMP